MCAKNAKDLPLKQSYLKLPELFYTKTTPTIVQNPQLIVQNNELVNQLAINTVDLGLFSGNKVPNDLTPIAQAYAGHQFGHFTMLGDGRAILLGELNDKNGLNYDIVLKGAGRTPYSRGGDGRGALGPMLREFLISEAMHALNIPTTRSLAVLTTGEIVIREEALPGAILVRAASSHLRIGTFQYARQYGKDADLVALADYAIERHFPELTEHYDRYFLFFEQVVKRQADLIAKWDLLGFVHGVMNTDNMMISGETIDYGPCAFIDQYNPKAVFSSIDVHGRYAYNQQKVVATWNLARLAESLLPILGKNQAKTIERAQTVLSNFSACYRQSWNEGIRSKLALQDEQAADSALIEELFNLMTANKADYHDTFRALTVADFSKQTWFQDQPFQAWYQKWIERIKQQGMRSAKQQEIMKKANPAIIPRNYYVETVLEKAVKEADFGPFNQFLNALAKPFAYSQVQQDYMKIPPENNTYQTYCGT
ncbi:Uncharacterized conserved protein YdiU, UPF0061 family [Amphibacillus marinus]|uniref:Protein nucleotidyltransferase YdiU n=1 Tax=Amphibacillus marinus TaxID=872970 RepID=A0A1H8GYT4_9BACI|nr:YdiU family protein [Amphibacillus marinus]SEN49163.1 Uncharacterized conserved protein YdiU, UPF0061 family [Amphibacillus marinus]